MNYLCTVQVLEGKRHFNLRLVAPSVLYNLLPPNPTKGSDMNTFPNVIGTVMEYKIITTMYILKLRLMWIRIY